MGVDGGGLGDEQSPRNAGPLGVILKGKVSVDVILVCPESCQRAENDTMFEVHTTDAGRLEELRHDRHLESGRCREVEGVL